MFILFLVRLQSVHLLSPPKLYLKRLKTKLYSPSLGQLNAYYINPKTLN